MQKGREKVSKQEFLDGLIDGKWAKGISNYTLLLSSEKCTTLPT